VLDAAQRLSDPGLLAGFDAEAAVQAVEKTAPQLVSWLARAVARLEPDQAECRHRRAITQRRVGVQLDLDGMGSLWAIGAALDLAAIDATLTRLANDLGADDPRSLEQRRADLFVDRLLGRTSDSAASDTSPRRSAGATAAPVVAVTVPVQSLLGLDDTPGEVCGGASVPAGVVREVLSRPGTLVYRLLTDPAGQLLEVAQLGRFPTARLGFAVDARDRTCVFPSCDRAALLCDADHTVPYPVGPTHYTNLGCLCRRHHRLKTSGQAQLKQVEPGVFEWTMRSGAVHTVRAERQPVGNWPTPCHTPPLPEPQPHSHDIAAHLPEGTDPETLTTEELNALLAA
jgi:hypothetical protein